MVWKENKKFFMKQIYVLSIQLALRQQNSTAHKGVNISEYFLNCMCVYLLVYKRQINITYNLNVVILFLLQILYD